MKRRAGHGGRPPVASGAGPLARIAAVSLCALGALGACRTTRPEPSGDRALPSEGLASFYSASLEGHLTASGEPYDGSRLTAAHRTLRLGSCVEVTNLRNRRSVQVRVTDRGPFVAGRVIDLSAAAARALDMVAQGVVPVRLTACR